MRINHNKKLSLFKILVKHWEFFKSANSLSKAKSEYLKKFKSLYKNKNIKINDNEIISLYYFFLKLRAYYFTLNEMPHQSSKLIAILESDLSIEKK